MNIDRDFINTRLLVHKHVKISVDKWIFEITHPHKQVTIFGIFFFRTKLENIFKTLVEQSNLLYMKYKIVDFNCKQGTLNKFNF